MAEEFEASACRRFVYMASIMQQFPGDFADGQHPRTGGRQASRSELRSASDVVDVLALGIIIGVESLVARRKRRRARQLP